ncbi:MAG: hypothetical protein K0Q73_6933 [Paenibacillus sp.]|nr:hypothetical protein [Paenibacillus sp.]
MHSTNLIGMLIIISIFSYLPYKIVNLYNKRPIETARCTILSKNVKSGERYQV